MTTTRKVNWLGAFKDFWRVPIMPSRCSSAPPTAFWISTTSVSRFLPAYLGVVTSEALCYTDALTDLWPSLKSVFSSIVFIQIQDEPFRTATTVPFTSTETQSRFCSNQRKSLIAYVTIIDSFQNSP